MDRLSLRLGACAFALLALSACDSNDPEPTEPVTPVTPGIDPPALSPLVGSWTMGETTTETTVTVNEAQMFVDQNGPVTGTIDITGGQQTTLRYMYTNPYYNSEIVLTSYDQRQGAPSTRYDLRVSQDGYATLYVSQDNGSYEQYGLYSQTPFYTYTEGRLTLLRALMLQSYTGSSATVRIAAGSLAFPTRALAAGQPTVVQTFVQPFDGGYGATAIRYILQADGVYRAERDIYPNRTLSMAGTWTEDGSRLRLSVTEGGQTETETFRYTLANGTLNLGWSADECRGDRYCLSYAEAGYGLRAGTMTRLEVSRTMQLAPSAAQRPARQTADNTPAFIAARREAAVWPRALAQPVAETARGL